MAGARRGARAIKKSLYASMRLFARTFRLSFCFRLLLLDLPGQPSWVSYFNVNRPSLGTAYGSAIEPDDAGAQSISPLGFMPPPFRQATIPLRLQAGLVGTMFEIVHLRWRSISESKLSSPQIASTASVIASSYSDKPSAVHSDEISNSAVTQV